MRLSKKTLREISPADRLIIPDEKLLSNPEKVLQFGTGVLLRGLPDYFIDRANRQGIFNGRIVIVKSTPAAGVDAFDQQDGLYTLCIRGIEDGKTVEENIIQSAVSRVLSAASQWNEILQCAADPNMQLIISNTTEIGIVLDPTDQILASPPRTFPAKLLAFLYQRYKVFNGDPERGMVVIPTELITQNGEKLRSITRELARLHQLDPAFIQWLDEANHFCNSLVDRIVPGRLPAALLEKTVKELGYTDDLMIMSEVYRLWAIESDHPKVKDILSFSKADTGVVISPDIYLYRELKLRLLNGSHTFLCGLAFRAGFSTVREAMDHPDFAAFIKILMLDELIPSITNEQISKQAAVEFAGKVMDRFRNPHIDHAWLSITLQYSSKMKMRNIPIIQQCLARFKEAPECICLGLASHVLFMKCELAGDGRYYGNLNGQQYPVNDDHAAWYAEKWKQANGIPELVQLVFGDQVFWGINFDEQEGFINSICSKLQELINHGAMAAIRNISQSAKHVELT